MSSFALPWFTRVIMLTGLMTASGCGFFGPSKKVVIGKVSGSVTLDGEPVQAGVVVNFLPKTAGADNGSGLVKDDGSYVATSGKYPGVPVGEYHVVILPPPMDPKEEAELVKRNSQVVFGAVAEVVAKKGDKRGLQKALDKAEYPQDAIVPKKYWQELTSGLKVSVSADDNVVDFELTSEKKSK